jgi:hypothetical protein
MKGASSWLTSLPIKAENYHLNKREFYDAIALRYRWRMKFLPSICACGKRFDPDHALSCLKGGFIHQRHDEIRDTIADMLDDVLIDVQTEPALLPVTGEHLPSGTNESQEARLDISGRGFWQRGQRAFFDVRVFNPLAQGYASRTIESLFRQQEREKKRSYNQRVINIENGTFTPLIFSAYGGVSIETDYFMKSLIEKLSSKKSIDTSQVATWLRRKISFALTRSAVLCIRGSRSRSHSVVVKDSEIVIAESLKINN